MLQLVAVKNGQFALAVGTAGIEEDDDRRTGEGIGEECIAVSAVDHLDGERRQAVPYPDKIRIATVIVRIVNHTACKYEQCKKHTYNLIHNWNN